MIFREFYNYFNVGKVIMPDRFLVLTKFNVGDKVKIVNVERCEFGYNPWMSGFIGETTIITGIGKILNKNNKLRVAYKIQIDENRYSWSANCFEPFKSFVIKNE